MMNAEQLAEDFRGRMLTKMAADPRTALYTVAFTTLAELTPAQRHLVSEDDNGDGSASPALRAYAREVELTAAEMYPWAQALSDSGICDNALAGSMLVWAEVAGARGDAGAGLVVMIVTAAQERPAAPVASTRTPVD